MEMEDKGLTILIRKILNYTDFLLLHDGSVGQVGLDGCPLKQDYTTPLASPPPGGAPPPTAPFKDLWGAGTMLKCVVSIL